MKGYICNHRLQLVLFIVVSITAETLSAGTASSGPVVVYSSAQAVQQRQPENRPGRTNVSGKKYTVKKGDTVYSIARSQSVDPAELMRMNRLNAGSKLQIGQILQVPAIPARASSRFIWPFTTVDAVDRQTFDTPQNAGITILSAGENQVRSAAAGKVVKIGTMRGYGQYIIITHADKYITVYSHLATISVAENQQVASNQVIGTAGGSPSKIHFQVGRSGKLIDPLSLLPEQPRAITRK